VSDPDWLPAMLELNDFGGDWNRFLEAVYGEFYRDFIQQQAKFQGNWVRCRRDPISLGKEAGFWHCISGGADEAARNPEIRRMERIRWARAVIEHASDPNVACWPVYRGSDRRWCLWFREEYLVVLAERTRKHDGFRYCQLITAYDTPQEHRKAKLRRERDACQARNG
jgi:hypothetical protein